MSNTKSIELDRLKIGNLNDWIKEFRIEDYSNNPPMIEKLHQEKQEILVQKIELEEKLKKAEDENNVLLIENRLSKQKNDEVQ